MNEGREEKKAEQFFLKKFGCTSKAKVMQEHFIGLSVIHKCIDAIEEYAADQLSKEREYNKALRQQNDVILEELKKERKMRKELVDTLKEIYEYITDEGILEDLAGVEELIKRASELDKNKT